MPKKRKPKPATFSPVREVLLPYLDERTAQKRRYAKVHRDDAVALRHLEYRSRVVQLHYERGWSKKKTGKAMGLSLKKVQWYLDWALERVLDLPEYKRRPDMPKNIPRPPTLREARILAKKSTPVSSGATRPGAAVVPGTGVPVVATAPATDPDIQKKAFYLRARALPVDEIAEILGIPEADIAQAIYAYANQLNASEVNTVETTRRVQLAQLDMALRKLLPYVTGTEDENGIVHELDMDHMDRFLKLMDQKAKLSGLNAPQRVDINVYLEQIAQAEGYDIEDLQEIYASVLRDFPQLLPGK